MKCFISLFLLLVVFSSICNAETYYVNGSNGNDGNTGSSWGDAFRTIGRGVQAMNGGDELIIADGIYDANEGNLVRYVPSGTEDRYSIIRAENDYGVEINGENLPDIDYTVHIDETRYVELRGIGVANAPKASISVIDSEFVKILNCYVVDTGNWGISFLRSNYSLVEGCFSWGDARYHMGAGTDSTSTGMNKSHYLIFRKNVIRWDYNTYTQRLACMNNYHQDHVYFFNNIILDGSGLVFSNWINTQNPETAQVTALFGANGPLYTEHKGNIVLNFRGSAFTLENPVRDDTVFEDNVIWDVSTSDPILYLIEQGKQTGDHLARIYGVAFSGIENNFNHNTYGVFNVNSGHRITNPDGYPVSQNSIYYDITLDNLQSLLRDVQSRYNIFYDIDTSNIYSGQTGSHEGDVDMTGEPDIADAIKYIVDPRDKSSVLPDADDGGERGAQILYQIGQPGTLYGEEGWNEITDISLWPWFNEDAIADKMCNWDATVIWEENGSSIHYIDGNRGFCLAPSLTHYIWEYLGNPCPDEICGGGSPPLPYDYSVVETSVPNEYGRYETLAVRLSLPTPSQYPIPTCFTLNFTVPSKDFWYADKQCYPYIPDYFDFEIPSTAIKVYDEEAYDLHVKAVDSEGSELFRESLNINRPLYDTCYRPTYEKTFPLGVYSISSDEYDDRPDVFEYLADLHMNTALGLNVYGTLSSELQDVIIPADQAGLDIILWLRSVWWWIGRSENFIDNPYGLDIYGEMTEENYDDYNIYLLTGDHEYRDKYFTNFQAYCQQDNILNYIIADEPVLLEYNNLNLLMMQEHAAFQSGERDVHHVLAAGSSAFESSQDFVDFIDETGAKTFNVDIYPWNRWWTTEKSMNWFISKFEMARNAAVQRDVDFYLTAQSFQQCCDHSQAPLTCGWIFPSPNEMNFQVNLFILGGGNGILYWKWHNSTIEVPVDPVNCPDGTSEQVSFKDNPELLQAVNQTNQRLEPVLDTLLLLNTTDFYNTTRAGGKVTVTEPELFQVGEFEHLTDDEHEYFGMLDLNFDKYSSGQSTATITYEYSGVEGQVEVRDLFSGGRLVVPVVGSQITFQRIFNPAELHLFKIGPVNVYDIDDSGEVDITDLVAAAADFHKVAGASTPGYDTDVNDDGKVDILDLVLVATHFTG